MKATNEIRAVDMVRRIRDEQARLLAGKSDEEVIEFFRRAGEAARVAALEHHEDDPMPPQRS